MFGFFMELLVYFFGLLKVFGVCICVCVSVGVVLIMCEGTVLMLGWSTCFPRELIL